jgi:glycosyltransferase involved in cell wall biosynthesis
VHQPTILFINRVFPPDRGATGRCLADLATRFAAQGWRVTVLACGEGTSVYGNPAVAVVRTGTLGGRAGGKAATKGIDYIFALGKLLLTALGLPRHDVVVTMTDPPLLASIGPLLRARWSCGLIHWSQDLYPDLFPIVGVKLPRSVLMGLDWIARAVLRRYDTVIPIGDCMGRRIVGKGVDPERLQVVPNWADPVIHPISRADNPMRIELGLGDRFTVAYSGNFGLAHPLDAVIDAAELLAERAWNS